MELIGRTLVVKHPHGLFAEFPRISLEDRPMSDTERNKLDEMMARIKDVATSAGSHLDAEGLMDRVRETIGKAASTVDSEAIVGRFKEGTGQAEGKIEASKLRQWVADV